MGHIIRLLIFIYSYCLVKNRALACSFQSRLQTMLSDKIDCAKFLTWFIEQYPSSIDQTRNANEAFWSKFK